MYPVTSLIFYFIKVFYHKVETNKSKSNNDNNAQSFIVLIYIEQQRNPNEDRDFREIRCCVNIMYHRL